MSNETSNETSDAHDLSEASATETTPEEAGATTPGAERPVEAPDEAPAAAFYTERALPEPAREHIPETAGELRALLATDGNPRVLLGAGEHIRPGSIGERTFDVIRTTALDRMLELDRESRLVTVEAGMTWGAFQEEIARAGLSAARYGLLPAGATLGGLMARPHDLPRQLFVGDLRGGCVAMQATSPGHRGYRYLAAPRKASGPDLRFLYTGSEGVFGVITALTLIAWDAPDARLYEVEAPSITAARAVWTWFHEQGVRLSWCSWSRTEGRMLLATHHLPAWLRRLDTVASVHFGESLEAHPAPEVATRRRALELDHPDRRTAPHAAQTMALVIRRHDDVRDLLERAQEVQALDWSQHTIRLFARFAPADFEKALARARQAQLLAVRAVHGGATTRWSPWAQELKSQLDPRGALAVGP